MSEQSPGEKTFAPSAKRLRDATQKGDVLRSKELATAVAMVAGLAALVATGPWLLAGLEGAMRAGLSFDKAELERFTPLTMVVLAMKAVLPPVLVIGLVVLVATVASQLLFGEGRWVGASLAPKASRINPLEGLKRMFGVQGLIELGKGLLKIGLLGALAWWWASGAIAGLLGLGRGDLETQLGTAWQAGLDLLLILTFGLALIALVDWPIQYVRRQNRLKMTFQEMRDESKEAEGSPEQRAAQRQRQREMARGGVSKAVREAQFVLVNPQHFAVALAYDPALAPAPIVLAKGRGERALAMRELAAEFAVPVLEYPALARSVYFTTRENQVIREELYVAIAALVAFVMALKRGDHPPRPQVEVPLTLRFDAEGRLAGG
ncbi:flagellar type III secretion system protein FlhB [Altererythrobacter sp. H2]|uniref:EscU/YscU/HrcU family type III secretion system export apparatus switch protein n=1 Tax=Altererythrobacter sp. H2 TaxID=3108391 RepID=UPI002B4BBA34|nr:flagellar type III secretion system protein FlhB [Altererythrobacter sp. H2]WRK96965.1 flagellar type III secretion system protein FlhB [Altererythrobacter sp. H2]